MALRWLLHRKLTHPVWLPAAHLTHLRGSDVSHIVFWGERVTGVHGVQIVVRYTSKLKVY